MWTSAMLSSFQFLNSSLIFPSLYSIPLRSTSHKPPFIRFLQTQYVLSTPTYGNNSLIYAFALRWEQSNDSPARSDPSLLLKQKAVELSTHLKGASIFLTGFNNTIKTEVGRLLADSLNYYYFDSDSLVEEAAGTDSTTRSFKDRDAEGFYKSETELLRQLSSMGRLVVCAGDGAVTSVTNLSFLRYGITVWIDVPVEIILDEIASESSTSEVTQWFEDMKGAYSTADTIVSLQNVGSKFGYEDLGKVSTHEMALEVCTQMLKLTRVKLMMEDASKPF